MSECRPHDWATSPRFPDRQSCRTCGVFRPDTDPRTVTITIPGRPPTPNVSTRLVWQARAKHVKHWRDVAATAADAALDGREWSPLERATLDVTFILPDHRDRDLDNLVASSKVLTDGLVRAGVLAGDSIRHITAASYGWEYRKGETATVYVVREAA